METNAEISKRVQKSLDNLEKAMREYPVLECPLQHVFTPGLYTRIIMMPADTLVASKIHKTEHPFFILKGMAWVKVNEGDWKKIEAPYAGITLPGTRRVLYIEEECIWATSHVLAKEGETVEEIEERIIEEHKIT